MKEHCPDKSHVSLLIEQKVSRVILQCLML